MKTDRIVQKISMLLIVFLLINTSCARWCANRFIPAVRDSVVYQTDTVFKDSTYYLPGNSIFIVDSLPCPDQEFKNETTKQKLTITIKDKKITGIAICKEDSLNLRIAHLERTIKNYKEITLPPVTVRKTPWWNVLIMSLEGLTILLLVLAMLKFKR